MTRIIILAGVAGSGKTTVGRALARRLDYPFFDGDDFHPPQNIAKMAGGEPLDDEDRLPWLQRLHELIVELSENDKSAVVACSALKQKYRRLLTQGVPNVCFVYLHGSFELIQARLQSREGHYMSAEMLQSQFEALEPPQAEEVIAVDVSDSVESVVACIEASVKERCEEFS